MRVTIGIWIMKLGIAVMPEPEKSRVKRYILKANQPTVHAKDIVKPITPEFWR